MCVEMNSTRSAYPGRFSARFRSSMSRCSSSSAMAPSCLSSLAVATMRSRVVCLVRSLISATSAKSTWAGAAGTKEEQMPAERARRLTPSARRVVAQARRANVRLVRFLYTDNGGVTRGKATHVESLGSRIADGIGLTVAMQAMNMLDQLTPVEGMGPVGEIRLKPDPQTFTLLPYAPRAAAMTVDMCTLDGAPWEACPRSFLKRQIAACAAAGFTVRAAFEGEFTLAVRGPDGAFAPLDQSLLFLHHWHGHGRPRHGRHRGRPRSAGNTGRAVLSGARSRPAGAVDPSRARPDRGRSSGALSRDGPRRRLPPRPLRLPRTQAVPGSGGQRQPRALEPLGPGGPAQPHPRSARALRGQPARLSLHRGRARAPARAARPHVPVGQLVPAASATLLELGLHGVGPGQSGGRRPYPLHVRLRPRGIDQRGAESVRRFGQSVPGAGRIARGRARRCHATARAG